MLLFKKDSTFNNIMNVYTFDKLFRQLLIGLIENIEIAFRTQIAYELAHQYGPMGYLNADNFNNAYFHQGFIDGIEKEKRNSKKERGIHVDKKYKNSKFQIY